MLTQLYRAIPIAASTPPASAALFKLKSPAAAPVATDDVSSAAAVEVSVADPEELVSAGPSQCQ